MERLTNVHHTCTCTGRLLPHTHVIHGQRCGGDEEKSIKMYMCTANHDLPILHPLAIFHDLPILNPLYIYIFTGILFQTQHAVHSNYYNIFLKKV